MKTSYIVLYAYLEILQAVLKRLMTDVPFGILLSGGLDSSLVAAVASRYLADSGAACQWGSQLHTFCVGLKVIVHNTYIMFDSNHLFTFPPFLIIVIFFS